LYFFLLLSFYVLSFTHSYFGQNPKKNNFHIKITDFLHTHAASKHETVFFHFFHCVEREIFSVWLIIKYHKKWNCSHLNHFFQEFFLRVFVEDLH